MSSKLSSMALADDKDMEGRMFVRKWKDNHWQCADDKSNVRFASAVDEIRPEASHDGPEDLIEAQHEAELQEMTPEAREEIKRLAMSQQKSRIQEQRVSHFAYDTFSLPASRVWQVSRQRPNLTVIGTISRQWSIWNSTNINKSWTSWFIVFCSSITTPYT